MKIQDDKYIVCRTCEAVQAIVEQTVADMMNEIIEAANCEMKLEAITQFLVDDKLLLTVVMQKI